MVTPARQTLKLREIDDAELLTFPETIALAVEAQGGSFKPGSAPRGAMERGAENLLNRVGLCREAVQKQVQQRK
eukprot:8937084-Pyramimonas_sp.AAC.1